MPIDYTDEDLAARWEEFFESSENRVRVAEVADLYPEVRSINIAYAELDNARVSRATALVSVGQQLSISAGVAIGALAVELTVRFRGDGTLQAADFPPAFLAVAIISALSVLIFARLPADAGAELAGRLPAPTEPSDRPVG